MKELLKNKTMLFLALVAAMGIALILFSGRSTEDDHSTNAHKEQQEALSAFLEETQGVGETHLQLCFGEDGEIMGAAVICEGGNDPYIASKVVRLLSAALGLPTNKIEVCGMVN